jgi:hypothetical protein
MGNIDNTEIPAAEKFKSVFSGFNPGRKGDKKLSGRTGRNIKIITKKNNGNKGVKK